MIDLLFVLFLGVSFVSAAESNISIMSDVTHAVVPVGERAKNSIGNAGVLRINNKEYPLAYRTLFETGRSDNGEIFGLLKDQHDQPLRMEDGSYYICNGTSNPDGSGSGLDFYSILQKNGKLYLVAQFECQVGAFYKMELEQENDGLLVPKKDTLEYISQKEFKGGYVHCAGVKTPWESHLGSEEYESDARKHQPDGTLDEYYEHIKAYFGGDLQKANPYYYGWVPEVTLDTKGVAHYTKHYTMGRFSHELAYVMPDRKTVYLSDDGTNVGFFKFVADQPEDLSSGRLYAAKWHQTSAESGGDANLTWIDLGHANDTDIKPIALDPNTKIGDYFEFASFDPLKGCPSGFLSINTSALAECIKLKEGADEKRASRLESRRYAALKGATTEFRKAEGITYDGQSKKLYLSMSEIAYGMEDKKSKGKTKSLYDEGGSNDIRLPHNECGALYVLDIDDSMSAATMRSVLTGSPKKYDQTDPYAGNSCDVERIGNPDNITFVKGSNLLIIGEDSERHINNMVWAFDTKREELKRIMTAPIGAETTALHWYSDIGGNGYLTIVTQHPGRDTGLRGESQAGYFGPFKDYLK